MTHVLSYREVVAILQLLKETQDFRRVDAQVGKLTLTIERERSAERSLPVERELGVKGDFRLADTLRVRPSA
jgi:hypothetical protein